MLESFVKFALGCGLFPTLRVLDREDHDESDGCS
jgi:hypothetical protein